MWTDRSYKYDDQINEYFVETQDLVKIRKSDIDKVHQAELVEGEVLEDQKLPQKQLLNPECKPIEDKQPGQPNGSPSLEDTKNNLNKFLESLHKKAALATSWVSSLEPPVTKEPTSRQTKFLGDFFIV